MFARLLSGHLKPGKFDLATGLLEEKIIPLLKDQPGFCDEVSFFNKDENEAVAISFWADRSDLERYDREIYPKVRDTMADAFEGTPALSTYEVGNSTWYNIHVS